MDDMDPKTALASAGRMVDLSHVLEEGIPFWPTHPRYEHRLMETYERGDIFCQYGINLGEHSGTHLDAPMHIVPGGASIDQVPIGQVCGRASTIDASHLGPNGVLQPSAIEAWEEEHGTIEPGDCVLIRFGWDRHWGLGSEGAGFMVDWPGISGESARLLVGRGVRMVATDALSIDVFTSAEAAPAHRILLGSDILIGENFNHLDALPAHCMLLAFPLPIKGGSGSPVRPVAVLSDE
jgi:kynurenine formamidase